MMDGLRVYGRSEATLTSNRFEENELDGIYICNNSICIAFENIIRFNKWEGIRIEYNSNATLTSKLCEQNAKNGIFIISSTCTAVNNECCLNNGTGISVDDSSVNLDNNRCERNLRGISFHRSSSGTANDNICSNNSGLGISINNNSSADLAGNRCEKNNDSGIIFSNSSTGTADKNICRLNKREGIRLEGCSGAVLTSNWCEGNGDYSIFTDYVSLDRLFVEGQDGLMITLFNKGTYKPCEALIALNLDRGVDGIFSLNLLYENYGALKGNAVFCKIQVINDSTLVQHWCVKLKIAVDQNGYMTAEVIDQQYKKSYKAIIL
jgi:parallel beta-helix repeat protein